MKKFIEKRTAIEVKYCGEPVGEITRVIKEKSNTKELVARYAFKEHEIDFNSKGKPFINIKY